MNLPALTEGGVFGRRYIVYEVHSVRKLFNGGGYYHFSLILPMPTAPKFSCERRIPEY
jgi:hypothetical protein